MFFPVPVFGDGRRCVYWEGMLTVLIEGLANTVARHWRVYNAGRGVEGE